ncbi:MAG TPA: hypothetical protein VG797_10290 [Phycisphaerales bacterium]|nr:hypothetical protein [Phycisphaerales bacterium]
MPTERGRRTRGWNNWPIFLAGAWLLLMLALGLWMLKEGIADKSTGTLWLAITFASAPISLAVAWRVGRPSDQARHQFEELAGAIREMTREGGLSEGAKRVLHRREERELLRRAIEQDITDSDWDAAMILVKELAERFGYRGDAEEFRTRIERARAQTLDQDVVHALAGLDDLIRRHHWPEAYAECARIIRLFPDSHRVEGLRERIDLSRAAYRRDLERRFQDLADKDLVDEAMSVLKELDAYLTPAEAGPFQELARNVIAKQRENLGTRFKLLVERKQWMDAVAAGERIINDFPNTRMATEVRELLPTLRERAESEMSRSV